MIDVMSHDWTDRKRCYQNRRGAHICQKWAPHKEAQQYVLDYFDIHLINQLFLIRDHDFNLIILFLHQTPWDNGYI